VSAALLALSHWAAEAQPGIWGQPVVLSLLALIGVIVAAAIGAAATVWVKRLNKPVDDATTVKTLVEAEKARVDVHGREVEIARGLLDEIRKELERVRSDQERARAEQERMREENDKRHRELAEELNQMRDEHRQLRHDLDDHIPWDRAAHQILRETRPDFPSPPPIGGH
jgi:uncharacterized protein (DUF3084 family)